MLDTIESDITALSECPPPPALAALLPLASLAACGGGGETPAPPPPPPGSISEAQASRFLAQASMGATRAQIARVQALGYSGWLDEQFALPVPDTRWDYLVAKGYNADSFKNSQAGFDNTAWRKLITSPDTLRQRVTLALSELLVVGIDGLVNGGGWKAFSAAAYLDLLDANAFGNVRTLLAQVSQSVPMGLYLTFKGNTKANATTGSMPDENYAREVMQLFSIGLLQLNLDGTPKLVAGKQQETYGQDDITGLARVFTGWDLDLAGGTTATPDYHRRPMAMVASRHETGAKTFLGTTIASGTDGATSLSMALDAIYAHPNVAPFWSRQLIQRLVTSNPSAAYVTRVATAFNNDGSGVKGNLKAVLKAVLLDDEARGAAGLSDPAFGKLREPILRFTAWARAFGVISPSDAWAVGNTGDPGTRLAQSPLRSPSVFNFFRPGYVPPNSAIANASLVGPEFQITNESSVVGYVNIMQRWVSTGVGDLTPDYNSVIALADNAGTLFDELNTVLAAGQLSAATIATMKTALDGMASGTDAARKNRVYAALVLVLAAPEFLVLK
jgi:uncharacterized protein (DUF1800 family)